MASRLSGREVPAARASRASARSASDSWIASARSALAEVAVARAQCQSVGRALGLAGHDLDRHGELLHHAADHHLLLVVLLAEHRVARALGVGEHALEQLHHHRADTDEEAGPEMALQDVGQVGRWLHLVDLRFRVELLL
jgi:hypothetical protein